MLKAGLEPALNPLPERPCAPAVERQQRHAKVPGRLVTQRSCGPGSERRRGLILATVDPGLEGDQKGLQSCGRARSACALLTACRVSVWANGAEEGRVRVGAASGQIEPAATTKAHEVIHGAGSL